MIWRTCRRPGGTRRTPPARSHATTRRRCSPRSRSRTTSSTPRSWTSGRPSAATCSRPAGAAAVWAPVAPAKHSTYAPRFHFLTGALMAVGLAAIAGLVLFIIVPGNSGSSDSGVKNWSTWAPTTDGQAGAQQIAEHVGVQYKLPDGRQIVNVGVTGLEIQGVPLAVAVRKDASQGGAIKIFNDAGVIYHLCGLGQSCAIDTRQALDRARPPAAPRGPRARALHVPLPRRRPPGPRLHAAAEGQDPDPGAVLPRGRRRPRARPPADGVAEPARADGRERHRLARRGARPADHLAEDVRLQPHRRPDEPERLHRPRPADGPDRVVGLGVARRRGSSSSSSGSSGSSSSSSATTTGSGP